MMNSNTGPSANCFSNAFYLNIFKIARSSYTIDSESSFII